MNDFLPDGYEVPTSANGYMKFKPGENRFRILSKPVLGYEWWVTEEGVKRPRRVPMGKAIPAEQIEDQPPKHFWALVVWNRQERRIQILEITQKGILSSIKALATSPDWGDPMEYDITVTREGEGMDTEYRVLPNKPAPVDQEILDAYEKANIRLEALFEGADPFQGEEIDLDAADDAIAGKPAAAA